MTEHRPADVTQHLTDGGVTTRAATDVRHELLADAHRRAVLAILSETNTPMDLTELARTIATRSANSDLDDPSSIEKLGIVLHHNHLPKLADADLIDYDATERRIVLQRTLAGFTPSNR